MISPGRRIAIIGSSGAGKSTLLRALVGLDPVSSGRLSIGGVEVRDIDEAQLRSMLSYVASEPGLTQRLRARRVAPGARGCSRLAPRTLRSSGSSPMKRPGSTNSHVENVKARRHSARPGDGSTVLVARRANQRARSRGDEQGTRTSRHRGRDDSGGDPRRARRALV